MSTSLYAPFRSLGHVTTDVPFVIHSHSTKDSDVLGPTKAQTNSQVILTSVGLGWALWSADSLRLLYVGPLTPTPITWLSVHSSGLVLASAGTQIYIYKRTRVVGILKTSDQKTQSDHPSDDSDSETDLGPESWINGFKRGGSQNSAIQEFISFGNQIVGLSSCGKTLWVWNLDTKELHITIELPPTFGLATTLVHPSTYLNRIVVAFQEGQLAIYNIQTGALIHIFQPTLFTTPSKARCSSAKVPITRMVQAPAVDIIAVGFADGWCSLVDVKFGEEILAVKMGQSDGSNLSTSGVLDSITGITFRSESDTQVMITSSSQGHLVIWNLNEGGRLLHIIREAHDSAISNVYFLPGQPVVVTASGDNSIKMWLFETPTGLPRLLTHRSGHQRPPHLIRYYGSNGKTILSAGRDKTLRAISIVRDSRSFELSQGSLTKQASQLAVPVSSLRLPPITNMSHSISRSKDWDDLLTCHEGSAQGRTWSVQNKRIGKHSFSLIEKKSFQLDPQEEIAKCVCVSACGNYGLMATRGSGKVGMWNMQSGMKRREFVLPGSSGKGKQSDMILNVIGIATDALNQLVIVATRSGHLHFYDFISGSMRQTVTLPSGATSILLQRDTGMLAINCSDHRIRILDTDTLEVIRQLEGFTKPILDMTMTTDSRWLVATSADSVIRTFDLPTGAMIDAFRTNSVATSVTFSPSGDFLASAHEDSVGIFLWVNRAQFSGFSYKSLPENYEIPLLDTPVMDGVEDKPTEELEALLGPEAWGSDPSADSQNEIISSKPLEEGLITLSCMPKSKWQTLLNLEVIKARNKPTEPPKAPERAPFFLPTVAGTEPRFNVASSVQESLNSLAPPADQNKKRKLDLGDSIKVEVEFTKRLSQSEADGEYEEFFQYLGNLSPSALDLEIRSLCDIQHLLSLMKALEIRLKEGKDFEMVQAILRVFLKVHGPRLAGNEEASIFGLPDQNDDHQKFLPAINNLLVVQEEVCAQLNRLVDYGIGVSAFVRGLTGVV
ncbi:hypothetical protein PTTG_06524 [Puccinia triticina 1-1 BBBD Race 1]|uniref:Small-subunit processome Utp21 domain-containing protein n=1 Tax=Puccinia triticina (isolate 1-1 / race 1 (BBBD)) TaxID=630390 RepID=A0A180GG85_PUCT1|nr:hypothetical protein PTTG_06524 [Puccinia triticina 1-1 BBBD Race 1]